MGACAPTRANSCSPDGDVNKNSRSTVQSGMARPALAAAADDTASPAAAPAADGDTDGDADAAEAGEARPGRLGPAGTRAATWGSRAAKI